MKKVLFITFYWPPSGKATLHWPLKIIKYLPEFGWQPSVLTVKEDTFSAKDESLLSEIDENLDVIRTGYFNPFNISLVEESIAAGFLNRFPADSQTRPKWKI